MIMVIAIIVMIMLAVGTGWLLITKIQTSIDNLLLPNSPVSVEISFVDKQLARMSLRQKVASLLILHTSGSDVATLQKYLQTYQPGGLIFMSDNIPSTLDDLATEIYGKRQFATDYRAWEIQAELEIRHRGL